MEFYHIPVLLNEVLENLSIKADGIYVDCTVGGAGHSSEIAKKLSKNGVLIAFDKDIDAIKTASERLKEFCEVVNLDLSNLQSFDLKNYSGRVKPLAVIIKSDFKNFKQAIDALPFGKVDGVLIDLGVSSLSEYPFTISLAFNTASLSIRISKSASCLKENPLSFVSI